MKHINKIAIISCILIILFTVIMSCASHYNTAIRYEEGINTSQSNISKEEQRRVDLFNNLVDSIESYNKFEKETFQLITDARGQANSGNIEQANLMLAMVVEAYPQLKSQENYKQAMLEFSITENRVASYREQYNKDIKNYNSLVRSFPTNIVLNIIGYTVKDYQYLEFEVDNSEARNLFENE